MRFKLLLVVVLHHIILAATATDIVVLRIGDNKICCTATRLTLATVTGKRICIVAAFFLCARYFSPLALAPVEWGGLLKNHYANNVHGEPLAVLWVRRNGV